MANQWYVVRGVKEQGPFTSQQLKQMATSGHLQPTDLVRRDDQQTPRTANIIKGLFSGKKISAQEPPPAAKAKPVTAEPRVVQPGVAGSSKKKLIILSAVIGASLLLCCGGFGVIGLFGTKMEQATRKELAEGDGLWDAGDKGAATQKYRGILDGHRIHFVKEEDRPRLYGRLIDFDVDSGNTESAKRVLAEASKKKVTPLVEHPEAKTLVAAEQARLPREQAAAKGEVLTADFYPFKKGTIQRTMHAAYWSTGETNSTREYAHDGDSIITMRLIEHFTTPGNANLPLGKPKQMLHREKDGYVEIGEEQAALKRTDWHPVIKIGAVEGDEWERQFGPTITEKYKVTKFGPEEVALRGDGSKETLAVATVEKQLIAALEGGKKMEMGEEIKLGKGVGPISRRSWRIENGKRERNWSEFIVPVVKK